MLFGVLVDVDIAVVASSTILLVALICRVLLDVALLSLLIGILRALLATRLPVRGRPLGIAGSLRALVRVWDGWHLAGHIGSFRR
ncbi:hypothetical protein ACVWYI_003572 [Bradyrhizobium sp. LB13.1]